MKADGCKFSPGGMVLKDCRDREIKSLTVPENVRKISDRAFRDCGNLKKIIFPAGLREIGEYAFQGCGSLQEIDLSSSMLTEMGQWVFSRCGSLVRVALPDTLKEIPREAFEGCTALKEVVLPNRPIRIGYHAFSGCTGLRFLRGSSSVAELGENAFDGCTSLERLDLSDCALKEIPDRSFRGCSSLREILFPPELKRIGREAFKNCVNLSDADPSRLERLETIEMSAFWNCRNLDLVLPENLADLNGGLYGVKSVDASNCRNFSRGEDGFLRNRRNGTIIHVPENYSGDYRSEVEGTLSIAPYAFYRCSGVTSVNCGPVEAIGDYAFAECPKLETARFEEIARLGEGVFAGCENLREVSFGNVDDEDAALTCIPARTFRDCRGLQKFVIPESIRKIGEEAFLRCRSLAAINIPYQLKELERAAFCGCSSLRQMILYCNLKSLGGSAFAFCENLRRVLLPESLSWINTKAFACCSNLSKINLPEGLKGICRQAFFRCFELEVRIPGTVERIESGALAMTKSFSLAPGNRHFACDDTGALFNTVSSRWSWRDNCRLHTLVAFPYSYRGEYTLPRNVGEISDMAFFGCSDLRGTLELGGNLSCVGKMAFSGCTSLTLLLSESFNVGEDGYEPGEEGFWEAAFSGVREIIVAKNVDYFYYDRQGALRSRNHGRVKYLPPDFTGKYIVEGRPETIYCGFLDGHPGVTEVVLPSSINTIQAYAFANCENLRRIEIPKDAGPLTIFYRAFANCPELREVILPRNVRSIDSEAFAGSPCEERLKRRYGHLLEKTSEFETSTIVYYRSWWEARRAKSIHDAGAVAEFSLESKNLAGEG